MIRLILVYLSNTINSPSSSKVWTSRLHPQDPAINTQVTLSSRWDGHQPAVGIVDLDERVESKQKFPIIWPLYLLPHCKTITKDS